MCIFVCARVPLKPFAILSFSLFPFHSLHVLCRWCPVHVNFHVHYNTAIILLLATARSEMTALGFVLCCIALSF